MFNPSILGISFNDKQFSNTELPILVIVDWLLILFNDVHPEKHLLFKILKNPSIVSRYLQFLKRPFARVVIVDGNEMFLSDIQLLKQNIPSETIDGGIFISFNNRQSVNA